MSWARIGVLVFFFPEIIISQRKLSAERRLGEPRTADETGASATVWKLYASFGELPWKYVSTTVTSVCCGVARWTHHQSNFDLLLPTVLSAAKGDIKIDGLCGGEDG